MSEQASAPQGPAEPTGSGKNREKKREISAEELAAGMEITPKVVRRLSLAVRNMRGPVRDKLTNRYNFTPDEDSASKYVEAGVARSFAGQRASGTEGVRELRARHRAAKWAIVTEVERTCWFNSSVSRYRSHHLTRALQAIYSGQELSDESARFSADAVEDFGFSVRESAGIITRTGYNGSSLGAGLIRLGRDMQQDTGLLIGSAKLLETVFAEQTKRAEYWTSRLSIMQEVYGDKLTAETHEAESKLQLMMAELEPEPTI